MEILDRHHVRDRPAEERHPRGMPLQRSARVAGSPAGRPTWSLSDAEELGRFEGSHLSRPPRVQWSRLKTVLSHPVQQLRRCCEANHEAFQCVCVAWSLLGQPNVAVTGALTWRASMFSGWLDVTSSRANVPKRTYAARSRSESDKELLPH